MLLKWFSCTVPDEGRALFLREQRRWEALRSLEGFVGQCAGFDRRVRTRFVVLGLWESHTAYQAFMSGPHDEIFLGGKQPGAYFDSATVLGEFVLAMPGECDHFLDALARAQAVRLADCRVKPEAVENFERAQHEVWRPGMAGVDGMLIGGFWRDSEADTRYLVSTWWRDDPSHHSYSEHRLPGLQEIARPQKDLQSIQGCLVHLDSELTVL